MSLVIDASVAVEYLLRTPLGQATAKMVEGDDLFAPALLDVEVLSALKRLVRTDKVTEKRAAVAIDLLSAWPVIRLDHVALLPLAWSYRDRVSAYDAFYVACARAVGAELLSADGPLARAPALDIVVHNVRGSKRS